MLNRGRTGMQDVSAETGMRAAYRDVETDDDSP